MKKLSFIWLFCVSTLFAQNVLTESDFLSWVLRYHPVAKQADLREVMAAAKLLQAKGSFDPKWGLDYEQKSFDQKNYYQNLSSEIKIPTWIAADVKIAYDWNRGVYQNPADNLPNNGLVAAGIELPLLQGLIIDKRRADLLKAKNYVSMGELERQLILNELIFQAQQAYWQWYEAYQILQIQEEGVILANNTFNMVKASQSLGDKPAIDTLEALIQIQNRAIDYADAQLHFLQNTWWLSSYIWLENEVPSTIDTTAIPANYSYDAAEIKAFKEQVLEMLDSLEQFQPKLQMKAFYIENLDIERKALKEGLKPKLNLGYNFINQGFGEQMFEGVNIRNYKWNLQFSMPLLFRKERGSLDLVKAELKSAELDYQQQVLLQSNKIQVLLAKITSYQEQLELSIKNVGDNRNLVQAEKRKFDIGESSLFLVNYREITLLKALEKQRSLETKLKITLAELTMELGKEI
jgi:outer membrane protein TolC